LLVIAYGTKKMKTAGLVSNDVCGGCLWWLFVVVVGGGCWLHLLLAAVVGGCCWQLWVAAVVGGCCQEKIDL
jgi:hypothetical protein